MGLCLHLSNAGKDSCGYTEVKNEAKHKKESTSKQQVEEINDFYTNRQIVKETECETKTTTGNE